MRHRLIYTEKVIQLENQVFFGGDSVKKEDIEVIRKRADEIRIEHPELRAGQSLWNTAMDYVYQTGDSDKINRFEALRASDKDCFYADEKIELFLEALENV